MRQCGRTRAVSHAPAVVAYDARLLPLRRSGRSGRELRRCRATAETVTITAVTAAPGVADRHDGEAQAGPSPCQDSGTFTWTRHWWPLMPVHYLATDRPTPVMLLGMSLVVWRDGSGTWRVFKDQCPHRMAPLSEGRVEADGTLSCSYHGWRFEGGGGCARIPQAVDAAAEATARASPRSCAKSYPTRVTAGLLWVWPDDAADAPLVAAAAQPELTGSLLQFSAELEAEAELAAAAAAGKGRGGGVKPRRLDWYMRELPYSYEVLMENLLDPAHLPFSHHGLNHWLKRDGGGPMPMTLKAAAAADTEAGGHTASSSGSSSTATTSTATTSSAATAAGSAASTSTSAAASASQPLSHAPPSSGGADSGQGDPGAAAAAASQPELPKHWCRPTGPDLESDFVGNIARDASMALHAPHHISYTYRTGQNDMLVELLMTPVAPGRSRFFTVWRPMPRGKGAKPPPIKLSMLPRILPILFDTVITHHRMMNELLDGDSVFLHMQDTVLRRMEEGIAPQPAAAGSTSSGASTSTASTVSSSSSTSSAAASAPGHVWSRIYHLPTPSDAMMLGGRKWLEERAGGGPFRARQQQLLAAGRGGAAPSTAAALVQAPFPSERLQLLDRYEQHTRHCPDCRTRLAKLQQLAAAARSVRQAGFLAACVAGGALGAAVAAAASASGAATGAAAGGAAGAGASAAAAAGLGAVGVVVEAVARHGGGWAVGALVLAALVLLAARWVERKALSWSQSLVFVDYVHAEKE